MKSIKLTLVLLALSIGSQSCSDFLEKPPLGKETDQTFFKDADNAVLAVNAIYDAVSWDENGITGGGHVYEYIYGDILSDDAAKGSTPGDSPATRRMERWEMASNEGPVGGTWANMYASVYRANQVITYITPAPISEELKKRLLGEAHFLRAFCYLNMVIKVGGLPIVETSLDRTQWGSIKRATIADTYKFIESDLKKAIDALPQSYDAANVGRATQGAARSFLARAYMYQLGTDNTNAHTWQEVYELTSAVIGSNKYSLEPNYAKIFNLDGENGPESIFEIQFVSNNVGSGPPKAGTTSTVYQGNRSTYGWGFNNPTVDFVNSFEARDPRLAVTVYKDGDICVGEQQRIDPSQNETGYLNRKGFLEPSARPSNIKDSPQNIIKFRYADILLMQAEAAYYIGKEAEARSLVNTIRQRARNSTRPKGSTAVGATNYVPYEDLTGVLPDIASTVTGKALLDVIWRERRSELGMESLRYYDMVRTGRYLDATLKEDPTGQVKTNATRRSLTGFVNPIPLLPLPMDEARDWKLDQNSGY